MAPTSRADAPRPVVARVLLVEDDPTSARMAATLLGRAGYEVALATTGTQALAAAEAAPPAAVVLDIGLPDMSGIVVARALRERTAAPILFLTAAADDAAKVAAYEAGGDDYLAKPYSPVELLLRLRAILRRSLGPAPASGEQVVASGGVVLDVGAHRVTVHGQSVDLTPREFALLRALMARGGRTIRRHDLLDEVWGPNFVGTRSLIDAHVHRLRGKIEPPAGGSRLIESVRGVGYRFAAPDGAPRGG